MDILQEEEIDSSHIHFLFLRHFNCNRVVFETENLSKSYGNKLVLEK